MEPRINQQPLRRHHHFGSGISIRRMIGAGFVSENRRLARPGLMGQMRASHRAQRRMSQWLAIAVLAGAFVALAFVGYFSK